MGNRSRSTSMNTLRDDGGRNGGPPPSPFGTGSSEMDMAAPGVGGSPPHAPVSWRQWLTFMLTIGVLVGATAVFVNYIVNMPPSMKQDVAEAKQDAAAAREGQEILGQAQVALGVRVEELGKRTPEPTTISRIQEGVFNTERDLAAVTPALAAAEAELQTLKKQISRTKSGADVSDLRADIDDLEITVSALARRVGGLERDLKPASDLAARVAALERRVDDFDLPSGTPLSDYVAKIARRFAGTGDSGEAVARLRRDMNSELSRVEGDINKLGRYMASVPSGTIVAWTATRSVPTGWAECDGRNGTPDLRNRFLYGASNPSYVGQRGGGGGGTSSGGDHWHHSDTWTDSTYQSKHAVVLVQGAAHPGKGVYAFYAHHSHGGGGSSLPAFTTVRFIMKL